MVYLTAGIHLAYSVPLSLFMCYDVIFVLCFSDTGTEPPESCIFGQMLNMCAVLGRLP